MESFNHSTDQTRTLTVSPEDTNQTRTVGMFMDSSDLDRIEMHPHLGLSSNPAKSEKQARFMRACAHGAQMDKRCPTNKVARKFMHT